MLTDVMMPQMGGFELAEKLAPLHPELVVLFMSGYAEVLVSDQALGHARERFMSKPFDAQDVAKKIRSILDGPS